MNFSPSKKLILWATIAICLAGNPCLYGQGAEMAFQTLKITLDLTVNVNRNTFHNYWGSEEGIETLIETPFYHGNILSGISFMQFSGKQSDIPDFTSLFIYLGWGKEVNIPFNIIWFNNIHTGIFYMYFNDKQIHRISRSENELGVGMISRLQYPFKKNWYLNLSGRYLVVYTHKRIYHSYIMFGISYRFNTPEWLRDFLR